MFMAGGDDAEEAEDDRDRMMRAEIGRGVCLELTSWMKGIVWWRIEDSGSDAREKVTG
jgi:hypothetical protein